MNILRKFGAVYSALIVFGFTAGLVAYALSNTWEKLFAPSWWTKLSAPFDLVIILLLLAGAFQYYKDYLFSLEPSKDAKPLRTALLFIFALMCVGLVFSEQRTATQFWGLAVFWAPTLVVIYKSGMAHIQWSHPRSNRKSTNVDRLSTRLDLVAPVVFYVNLLCLLLAAGWFLTSDAQGRWEPAIVFFTLLATAIAQMTLRKHVRNPLQSRPYFLRTGISILSVSLAFLVSKPSQEAHIGAIAHAESLHWHEHFASNSGSIIGKNPAVANFLAKTMGFSMVSAHSYEDYLFFSLGRHKYRSLSIGVLGYVIYFGATKIKTRTELYSSWQGERYLADYITSMKDSGSTTSTLEPKE
jgi:hypothetical protein